MLYTYCRSKELFFLLRPEYDLFKLSINGGVETLRSFSAVGLGFEELRDTTAFKPSNASLILLY
jgi:hypothetical protein